MSDTISGQAAKQEADTGQANEGERGAVVSLDQSDAIALHEILPNKDMSFEEAFPGVEIENA